MGYLIPPERNPLFAHMKSLRLKCFFFLAAIALGRRNLVVLLFDSRRRLSASPIRIDTSATRQRVWRPLA
jgi:hypothetical protein